MNLKLATIADTQTIYNLAEKIWLHHYVPIVGEEQVRYMLANMYSYTSLQDQMENKMHQFYLIIHEEITIGFISVSGISDMKLHKFYISQDIQNKGIGKLVFQEILQLYPTLKSIELTVNRLNYKSINFYFRLGFQIESIADFDIGNGYWMNDFIMKYHG